MSSVKQSDPAREQRRAVMKQHRGLPHMLRRIYHLVMGLGCFFTYAYFIERSTACWLIACVGGPFFLLDVLRLQSPWLKRLALKYFGPVMRRNELLGLSGNSFFILGLFTVVFWFSKPIALLSILFLAIGDPVAAFFGTRYGRIRFPGGKSLEGSLAGFIASAVASGLFGVFYLDLEGGAWILAGVGGLVSMLAELVPFPVDDNFSVPVLSALGLSVVQSFWPFF